MKEKIIELIYQISPNGWVNFNSRLVCKMSPHSTPTILWSVSVNDDFDTMDKNVLQTIFQRLKWMEHENRKNFTT